jgi:hypothetical protein
LIEPLSAGSSRHRLRSVRTARRLQRRVEVEAIGAIRPPAAEEIRKRLEAAVDLDAKDFGEQLVESVCPIAEDPRCGVSPDFVTLRYELPVAAVVAGYRSFPGEKPGAAYAPWFLTDRGSHSASEMRSTFGFDINGRALRIDRSLPTEYPTRIEMQPLPRLPDPAGARRPRR